MTAAELRSKIVATAKKYIGANRGSVLHKEIIRIFNTVKPDGWAMDTVQPWCATFVSAMAIEAFGKETAKKYFPMSASCGRIIQKAKSMGIWVEKDSYTPEPGDWILYDWGDSGYGEDTGDPDHVGLVSSVSAKRITVIEGNKSNSCAYRYIAVDGRYIRGFVTPKYAEMAKASGGAEPKKTVDQIAQEVIDGKWSSGAARKNELKAAGYDPDAVQKKVNEILSGAAKKTVEQIAKEVINGKWGNGSERKKKLQAAGYNPVVVQNKVNEMLRR